MDFDAAALVKAAAVGNRDAWDRIVDRYAGLVWAVIRSFGLGAADAADVSQVTWLRLVENLERIRQPEQLGSWLATTAKREATNVLRQRRQLPLPDDENDPGLTDRHTPPPWQPVLDDERDRELWQAFQKLPPRCQTVLRLLIIEPVDSYTTAAAALDMPVGSLGPTRARCLSALRAHLDEHTSPGGTP